MVSGASLTRFDDPESSAQAGFRAAADPQVEFSRFDDQPVVSAVESEVVGGQGEADGP